MVRVSGSPAGLATIPVETALRCEDCTVTAASNAHPSYLKDALWRTLFVP